MASSSDVIAGGAVHGILGVLPASSTPRRPACSWSFAMVNVSMMVCKSQGRFVRFAIGSGYAVEESRVVGPLYGRVVVVQVVGARVACAPEGKMIGVARRIVE
jgi:hypothetical protein